MNQTNQRQSVFEGVTVYHWIIVIIASCGWLFDCMDQRLFVLARESTLREVLGSDAAAQLAIKKYIGWATGAMIFGWATGGIVFGMMSDKIGRVKTMVCTLIVYSGFTGLSGCATSWLDFTVYRFLVGLGVGGMFGAATTLVAESVPSGFRSMALGSLQALSAMGNMTGSWIAYNIPPSADQFLLGFSGWRILFFVGILPALLVIPIVTILREPEAWKRKKAEMAQGGAVSKQLGSPFDLFKEPRWRRNTIVGLLLGVSGMIGLWGIGFFSPELITMALMDTPMQAGDLTDAKAVVEKIKANSDPFVQFLRGRLSQDTVAMVDAHDRSAEPSEDLKKALTAGLNAVIEGEPIYAPERFSHLDLSKTIRTRIEQNPEGDALIYLNRLLVESEFAGGLAGIQGYIDGVRAKGTLLQDVGSFLGMFAFTLLATYIGRRVAFLGSFILCLVTTIFVFYSLDTAAQAYWMLPLMGFAQLAVFGGYSIYFPELFPTRLRGTGVGFCYNTVRYLAVPAPIAFGYLSTVMSIRTAAVIMSFIYVLGMVALIWAPETKGQDLPED
ncbi:MAG TPA: MFS transporter [bacterium]|nr:MFS transporter [bacterium]HQP98051.1 MFS transporter [bacterium]